MKQEVQMVEKSLDRKLAEIHANRNSKTFILADAKDADMAFGIRSGGVSPESYHGELRFRSIAEYREMMRQVTIQAAVDIMLMSASSTEILAIQEHLFDNSPVTPAVRANDTTDIHLARHGIYVNEFSRPFRSATIDHAQCGKYECAPSERGAGANLGLYSVTFNNNHERDLETLRAFKEFRLEAEEKGFRYFLEVFDPNMDIGLSPEKIGEFVNDMVTRSLAGVTSAGRPLFLKMVYHGPKAMEELVNYDPHLIVGILGGSAGTTYDAFKLIHEAQKYGARIALFGRKINNAEHQLAFVRFLRLIVDGAVSPEDAVPAYHAVLQGMGIKPHRSLEDDSALTTGIMSYGGSSTATIDMGQRSGSQTPVSAPLPGSAPLRAPSRDNEPDWSRMTPQEKLAYNQRERDRIFG
ncbi:MAG TPA: hypothetical protein PLZ55_13535 [bacterium]|nr:hypothetical protein [bacterium]HQO33645.1 hypothetical protein [bacterium]